MVIKNNIASLYPDGVYVLPNFKDDISQNSTYEVIVLYQYPEDFNANLPSENYLQLTRIVEAVKIPVEKALLLNIHPFVLNNYGFGLANLIRKNSVKAVIGFGVPAYQFGVNFNLTEFSPIKINSIFYLQSCSLDDLMANKIKKQQLWACLKQIFGV